MTNVVSISFFNPEIRKLVDEDPRPDRYDGCWNCIRREGNICEELKQRVTSGMGPCSSWGLRG